MKLKYFSFLVLFICTFVHGQSLPGDKIVFGPMFSPVYNDSVRVWVLTEDTGTGNSLSLSMSADTIDSESLIGSLYQSDDRLGYHLRTYLYTGLSNGVSYTAQIMENDLATDKSISIKNENNVVDDFSFLSGGCARIYDLSRCIDRPESQTHKNGDPEIFNRMADEDSDMMIWLGDATYLLGLQHANGQCPDAIDDWANKDTAFARYMFYRQFHDKLLQSMPQLSITDNHDMGPNEWNKNLPSLPEMKEIFMEWWPNPEYLTTPEGQGLFSSYQYKDVEYFLIDNRSFRDDTRHHLGPDQFEWLKTKLAQSTATFKILINATPSFAKHWGGRNFSVTEQGEELLQFIQEQNIDGVISFSADIHRQEFYGRYGGVKYPLYDIISGNLNSDVGDGNYSVNYSNDVILSGVKQTYLKISLYGEEKNRRMKIAYTDLEGNPYFESIIHEDMLTAEENEALKLELHFNGQLQDSSPSEYFINGNVSYAADRDDVPGQAAAFDNSEVHVTTSSEFGFHDRSFSVAFWINPSTKAASSIISNADIHAGITLGTNELNQLTFTDHANNNANNTYVSTHALAEGEWSHVVWQYDNVKRQLKLYYNGLLSQQWNNIASPSVSTADISLGVNAFGGSYVGLLDEVKLYGKLLSDIFIQELAEYESNRSEVIHLSGGQNVSITGDDINPALAQDFTIEFWGRVLEDPNNSGKILASNSRVDGNTAGISFEFSGSNRLNVVLGTNSGGWNAITDRGNPWQIGEWHHIAVSAIQNDKLYYYIDGELAGETDFSAYVPNPTGLGLGDSPYYGSEVRAELDELRIWNRALSQEDIRQNMFTPISNPTSDLVFYFDFNGQGSTSISSKGSNPLSIPLEGADIIAGSAPNAVFPNGFNSLVEAKWSANGISTTGFSLTNSITNYQSNIIIGSNPSAEYSNLNETDNRVYLTSGWLVNPSNIISGDLSLDLSLIFSDTSTTLESAYDFKLIKGNPTGEHIVLDTQLLEDTLLIDGISLTSSATFYLSWRDARQPTFKLHLEAEDFDHRWGVLAEPTEDEGGGKNLAWISKGDWMIYKDINIPETGHYLIEYRVASPWDIGQLRLNLNWGTIVVADTPITKTGGWQTWDTVSEIIYLNAGTYDFGLLARVGGWNLNWWRLEKM